MVPALFFRLGLGPLFALRANVLQLLFGQMFNSDKEILGFAVADQFVQLHLDRRAVPILRILNEKDHEECDDRGAGIDDQLPGIGKIK